MFQTLGAACIFLPPLTVFILEALEFTQTITLPLQVLVLIYPIGMFVLVLYALSIKQGAKTEHYLEFAKGARIGTILVLSGSVVSAFFPVFFGEPSLGTSLLLISLGSIWLPSIAAAGAFGSTLIKTNETALQEHGGTSHYGIMLRFLSLSLGEGGLFKKTWRDSVLTVELLILLVSGWVLLSVAGGFPLTLVGLSIVFLIPISSHRLFMKTTSLEDRSRIKDILDRVLAASSDWRKNLSET